MAKKKSPEESTQVEKKETRGGLRSTSFGQLINMEPGDNARFTRNAMEVAFLPKIDLEDSDAVDERILQYFEIVTKNDMKPTVAGLALALGMSRMQFIAWMNGNTRNSTPRTNTAIKAFTLLNQLWEDYMMNGKVNPASGIFIGKNNFGYVDKIEIDTKGIDDQARAGKTDDELEGIYDGVMDIDAEIVE